MMIHQMVVGEADSTPIESYTLDNGIGLAVEVWTWGATLVEVRVPDRSGHIGNVVLRLPDLATYHDRARNPYVGATVGRYCRCVANGRMALDGVVHELDRNDGRHHLHGGSEGFDRRAWSPEAGRDGDQLCLRLSLDSPDGDQGYPGAVRVECDYRIDRENRLLIDYRAITSAPTIIGLTNHAFWNLAGAGEVNGHQLTLNSRLIVPFDDELIPLPGPPRDVTGTKLDFSTTRAISGERLDNFFVLDDPAWAAELHDPGSGRLLQVSTEASGVGVYSADGYSRPRAGLCLETGAWPDAPNRPDFPSARLNPGEVHRSTTVYAFSVV